MQNTAKRCYCIAKARLNESRRAFFFAFGRAVRNTDSAFKFKNFGIKKRIYFGANPPQLDCDLPA